MYGRRQLHRVSPRESRDVVDRVELEGAQGEGTDYATTPGSTRQRKLGNTRRRKVLAQT